MSIVGTREEMKFSRYLRFVPIFTICCSVVASPQAGNPVTALEELVTAENVTDAVRHYPFAVELAIEGLTEEERAEAAKVLVISQKLRERGYELHRTSNPIQWELVDANGGNDHATFTLLNSFISGVDAVVLMRVDFFVENKTHTEVKAVSLCLDAGEWRIKGVQSWVQEQDFESEELLQELTPAGRNEIQAVATLYEIHRALMRYYYSYPDAGFPLSLATLSGPAEAPTQDAAQEAPSSREVDEPAEPSKPVAPQYTHMLDPGFMLSPVVKDGYEFRYNLIDPGTSDKSAGSFQITATPLHFGKSGNKNFFIDKSSVIRFTKENREANENDEPLNHGPDIER